MSRPKVLLRMLLTAIVVTAAVVLGVKLYERSTLNPWTRDGQVNANITLVTPQVSGNVVKVGVVDGQEVAEGTLLFEIDPRPFAIAVESCQIQLAEARQEVAALEAEIGVAEAQVEMALTGIESARGRIEAARAQIDGSQGMLASAEARMKAAEASVDKCQAQLNDSITRRDRAIRLAKDGAGSVATAESRTAAAEAAQATLAAARADQRSAVASRDQAEAGLAQARANLIVAQTGLGDAEAQHASSLAALRKAQATLGVAGEDNVRIQAAKASLARAELDLSWTTVTAPTAGYVTNLVLKAGDYASAGKPVLAFVDGASFYVQGFFRETQIAHIEVGNRAVLTLMSHDDQPLEGVVEAIGRAINPPNVAQTGAAGDATLVPVVQPTFEWIRLAQRVPVRVKLTSIPDGIRLIAGLTTSVSIESRSSDDG